MILTHYKTASAAIQRLHIQAGHAVLDIGCGDGYHVRLASEVGHPLISIGLDIDAASLRQCARQSASSNAWQARPEAYVAGNALQLPFRNQSFDRIICCLVLYMLPLERSLQELHRVLKPNGKAFLRVPMLSAGRAIALLQNVSRPRHFAYGIFHVLNGLFFFAVGRQASISPTRACYLPKKRFEQSLIRTRFQVDELTVDSSKALQPSLEAWVTKSL